MESDWKQRAEALFFGEGKSITELSAEIGVSVRSISKYLNSLPHYEDEVKHRIQVHKNRTEYYREYKRKTRAALPVNERGDRPGRNGCLNVNYHPDGDSLKQEHITAVKILSRERFFK